MEKDVTERSVLWAKNLTAVTMPRSNGTQTRTFTYQSGTNWLLTATNPENGTVTYTRDAMGHVTKRVDAMGQTTNYTYDSYSRLTLVTRSPQWQGPDPCQSETYYYDQSIDPNFSSGASWGKLTAVAFGWGTVGAGVCPGTGSNGSSWAGMVYEYQYSSAGRTTGKRMAVTRNAYYGGANTIDLDAHWTYDNEGRVLSVQYPVVTDPNTGNPTSTVYSYTYDTMGRPISMPNGPYAPYVNGVQYNAGDQLTAINYFGTGETRGYNSMNQITSLMSGAMVETYVYPGGQNNGQISSVVEGSGETVSYQYDRLKRLIAASSTFGWSQQYGYDGFGNMTYKSGNFNALADPATNRLAVGSYDANGNMYLGNWNYDVENRLVGVDAGGGERYMYDPSNKRVYKQPNGALETYFFYGVDGKVMGEYQVDWNDGSVLDLVTESAYFGGKKVLPSVGRDRLGSVRAGYSPPANHPYGENYPALQWGVTGTDGFATYYQDSSTGLNYADQRYYNATYGRFNTPDRYKASVGPSDPGSWNRYAYVGNDPLNYNDRTGRIRNVIGDCDSLVDGYPQDGCDGFGDDGDYNPCASEVTYDPACGNAPPDLWIHLGEDTGPGAASALTRQNAAIWMGQDFSALKSFSTKSTPCLNDLKAVGMTPGQVDSIAGNTKLVNVTSLPQNVRTANFYPGMDMTAVSHNGNNFIVYNQSNFWQTTTQLMSGTLLHEIVHLSNSALTDAAIAKKLGVTISATNTSPISVKLATDCFGSQK